MGLKAGTLEGSDTTASINSEPRDPRLDESVITAFVIAWYPADPARVGEIGIIPSDGGMAVLGRGAPDAEPRMRFFQPRPGRLAPAPPLSTPGLSRRQLEIRATSQHIDVRCVGKCPLRINGIETQEGRVAPGDTLAFRQELLLLCLRRPACPAPLRHWSAPEAHAFGAPDPLGILGETPAIWLLRDELAFAAKSGQHVLLTGESGTGKELAARAVHQLSSRSRGALIARNAATLPSGLIDAEVFGNQRNYPNPGMADRPGLVGQADGGFLFLDEIAELPLELQSHLLRVLDKQGEYQKLGDSAVRRSDFRLLAASNRDPRQLRHDLLARLAVRIELPPLSERREDIPLLLRHLVLRAAVESPDLAKRFTQTQPDGQASASIDTRLVDALLRRRYPGNVRDLESTLWKAMAESHGDVILHTQRRLENEHEAERTCAERPTVASPPRTRNREPSPDEIREALQREGGNVTRAAEGLGLSSRYALHRMLRKLELDRN